MNKEQQYWHNRRKLEWYLCPNFRYKVWELNKTLYSRTM